VSDMRGHTVRPTGFLKKNINQPMTDDASWVSL